jgi:hypothetical protein
VNTQGSFDLDGVGCLAPSLNCLAPYPSILICSFPPTHLSPVHLSSSFLPAHHFINISYQSRFHRQHFPHTSYWSIVSFTPTSQTRRHAHALHSPIPPSTLASDLPPVFHTDCDFNSVLSPFTTSTTQSSCLPIHQI